MFSLYTNQIVKQEQLADLHRQAAHNQLVRQALAARTSQQADLVSIIKRNTAKLTHNTLYGLIALGATFSKLSHSK